MSLSDAPITPSHEGAAAASSPASAAEKALSVLVADDSRIDRRIACSILEGRGHRVSSAADGTAALEAFREAEAMGAPFDAAVIDFQMPGMGGEELALALREAARGRSALRIVLLSGVASEKSDWRGIDAALPKPLDPLLLADAVEAASSASEKSAPAPAPVSAPAPVPVSAAAHGLDRVVFDLGEALARARGKRGLLVELVKIFMDDSETYLVALRQAAAEGNVEKVEKAAHRLKGSSANVSAQRAADAAEKIEKTVRATHGLPEASLVETLVEELAKVRKALAGFLAQNREAQA